MQATGARRKGVLGPGRPETGLQEQAGPTRNLQEEGSMGGTCLVGVESFPGQGMGQMF